MLAAAAVCPHPPLLVPALASGAAGELDELRAACDAAVLAVLEATPDEVVVVGSDPRGIRYGATAGASMRPYGVDVRVGGPDHELPLALAVGAWLVDRSGSKVPRRFVGVPPDASTSGCLAMGAELMTEPGRTGLLVMGDGSARRTTASPGRFDERAVPFDDAVVAALSAADADALAALDAGLADELMVAGRAAWQVLAGAASTPTPDPGHGQKMAARVLWSEAPYGVGYVVAAWEPARRSG